MALQLFKPKQNMLNVYISNYSIQLLEIKSVNPLVVHRFYETYLPEGTVVDGLINDAEKLLMILEQCINDWGIKRKQVRFITPDSYVSVRKVKIPLDLKEDEIKGYLYLEIGNNIHLPFEDPVFDFVSLGKTETEQEILLFAAPESVLNQYIELFESLKLEAKAADLSALCSFRYLYEKKQLKADANTLLVEVKLDSVNVSIFEDLKPIFTRHIQFEGMMKAWSYHLEPETQLYYQYDVADKDKLSGHFNDIVKEIEKIISFYRFSIHQGNNQISHIILIGDNPYIDDIFKMLQINIESIPFTHYKGKEHTHKNIAVPVKFHTVLGLALKEV